MTLSHRPLVLPDDLTAVLNLADGSMCRFPHVADWPYRFSSWALDNPLNTQAWIDDSHNLFGWTVLQTPFWAIDCISHPNAPAHLYREMLEWAASRAAVLTAAGDGRPMWFVSISADCLEQRNELAALGFEDVSDIGEDSWSKVLFELVNDNLIPAIQLPDGLQMRSLNSKTEIQAYVDMHREVFQTENMTTNWRKKSTEMQDYHNELDLVIATETGELIGFCVAWLRRLVSGETVGQIEPLGVRESHRGQKLSRQLMSGAIRRLRSRGAQRIFVETDRQRTAAMAAYEAMGFRVSHEVLVYKHVVSGSEN